MQEDLVRLSLYYGFTINVTNCYSGNEKGHVEGSVKTIRNKCFSHTYTFETLEDAQHALFQALDTMNQATSFPEEQKQLLPSKPPLDLAEVTKAKVNKYAAVRIENNFYSVPEHLTEKEVVIKNYLYTIEIYDQQQHVASHKKRDGYLEYYLDINHYLQTLKMKPGALRNAQALVQNKELKSIYETYYTKKAKLFIELLTEHKHKTSDALNTILKTEHSAQAKVQGLDDTIEQASRAQIATYTTLLGGNQHAGY